MNEDIVFLSIVIFFIAILDIQCRINWLEWKTKKREWEIMGNFEKSELCKTCSKQGGIKARYCRYGKMTAIKCSGYEKKMEDK